MSQLINVSILIHMQTVLRRPFGTYAVVALDTSLQPGLRSPFNFFGYLSSVHDVI